MTDAELIAHHGGPTKLAKVLGFPERGGVQRIQNWIARGIPPAVKVRWPDLFLNVSVVTGAPAIGQVAEPAPAEVSHG